MTRAEPRLPDTQDKLVVITQENYRFLQQHVYQHSGIVLDDAKHYLLEARLVPIVRDVGLVDLNALCQALRSAGEVSLRNRVVEAMTTNETLFFRDKSPFDALRVKVLPELRSALRGRPVRIWSAAASTGQEAYSIAMLLLESGLSPSEVEILGTDLNEEVLARARGGVYSQLEVNRGLPAPFLVKYFTRRGMSWEVQEPIRRMARFQQLDLRSGIRALGMFDLVFCRNVLIYFDIPTKQGILKQIRSVMQPHAYLFLGSAETTLNVDERFSRKVLEGAVVYQVMEAL